MTTVTKSPTPELLPHPSEQPQPRHLNAYDCEHEYEFPFARHWTASEAGKRRVEEGIKYSVRKFD